MPSITAIFINIRVFEASHRQRFNPTEQLLTLQQARPRIPAANQSKLLSTEQPKRTPTINISNPRQDHSNNKQTKPSPSTLKLSELVPYRIPNQMLNKARLVVNSFRPSTFSSSKSSNPCASLISEIETETQSKRFHKD
ncbi:hypothetical protein Droror1_Dr00004214 [Drosera rotundifolia]